MASRSASRCQGCRTSSCSHPVITTLDKQAWAAKNYWHANTIRYQILQDRLVGSHGNLYAPYYMHYIKAVTDYSLRLGLYVVLNAQTELSIGYSKSEPIRTTLQSVLG